MQNFYTLITGASSGIGLALAKRLAKQGEKLVLVARRGEILRQFQQNYPTTVVIEADLSTPEAPIEIWKMLRSQNIEINCLVNNAGVGLFGEFINTDLTNELAMIQLNISSLVALTKLALPSMQQRNSGKIINVGSMAGFMPGSKMSVYYATKAFVCSFSQALAFELRKTNIEVITLAPGPTATEFEKASKLEDSGLFKNLYIMSADEVVNALLKQHHSGLVVPNFINKIFLFLAKIAPRKVVIWVTAKIQENK